MTSLYTNEVREYVNTRPWPKGLKLTVTEPHEPEPHLLFIFYRDNWLTFDSDQQMMIANIVGEVMNKLRRDGIPCYMGKQESDSDASD